MCEPSKEEEATISGCDHTFCFSCIGKWSERENKCPLCKVRFNKITRVKAQRKRRGGKSVQNVKTVKNCDQRSDLVSGSALEAMLNSIAAANGANSHLGRLFAVMRPTSGPGGRRSSSRTTGGGGSRVTTNARGVFQVEIDDDDDDTFNPADFSAFMRNAMQTSYQQARSSAHAARATNNGAGAAAHNPFSSGGGSRSFMSVSGLARAHPPARSHASNGNDANAGAADNPLILDDGSDDDVVEILD